ncbi:MAG: proline--tRNA ligase [Planctomycetota bacterium]
MAQEITPRSQDFSRWYTDVIAAAQLADYAPVKGCMVIRPNGFAIWENIQKHLDAMFKETGHSNAYFPLLIPESFMRKEAEHVEGFAPEVATVTHAGGSELEEPLCIRPTSETVIWDMYRRWIQSYRDLPLLINQWCNIVRWEMRTRLFLRTTEFLWQEGHTAHATETEAREEVIRMLNVYRTFAEEYLAIPVLAGRKSESEKFAGAVDTYSIEALMQDGKALQAGTSHYLGQNFAKAFNVTFLDEQGERNFVYATSWGVSTRLIGALIMAHGDDNGVVMPPRVAPLQLVIVPIWKGDDEKAKLLETANRIAADLKPQFTVKVDDRDNMRPGAKFFDWEKRGTPLRIELGPKDLEKNQVVAVCRHDRSKHFVPFDLLKVRIAELLGRIQEELFNRALEFRARNTTDVETLDEMLEVLDSKGGFVRARWNGSLEAEALIKNKTKATIRNIELEPVVDPGPCVSGLGEAKIRVHFARAY